MNPKVPESKRAEIIKYYFANHDNLLSVIANKFELSKQTIGNILTEHFKSKKTMYNIFRIELINGEKSEPIERSVTFENRKEMDRARRLLSLLISKRVGHKTDVVFHYKTV
jgi:hypothetical protein